MAALIQLTPTKTYASRENAIKAVEKAYGPNQGISMTDLHYIVQQDLDGRWFPVFIGERAVQHQVFRKFCVIA